MNIALIADLNKYNPVVYLEGETFVTHSWVYDHEKGKELIGGTVSLHVKQKEMSWAQGKITSVFPMNPLNGSGRQRIGIVFNAKSKRVNGAKVKGWAAEQARY